MAINEKYIDEVLQTEISDAIGNKSKLKQKLEEGPVILNFIAGTWCPMCLTHLQTLTEAVNTKFTGKNVSVVIISTEPINKITSEITKSKRYLEEHKLTFLFASDWNRRLVNIFKIKVPIFGFSKPATILIKPNQEVVILSMGTPNSEKTICELSANLSKN